MRTVLLIVLAVAAPGCGQAIGSSAVSQPPTRPLSVSGGTAVQRALVHRILADMGRTSIRSVTLSPTDPRWHPVRPGDVTMRVTVLRRPRFVGAWQASLLGGAFHDLSAAAGLPRVLVLETPDGGERLTLRPEPAGTVSAERLEQVLRDGVRRTGAELVSLEVSHPDGPAGLVVMRTDRPAWFLRHRFTRFFAPEAEHADGVAEIVVDGREGCDPFVHSMPFGYSPPPCPAG